MNEKIWEIDRSYAKYGKADRRRKILIKSGFNPKSIKIRKRARKNGNPFDVLVRREA